MIDGDFTGQKGGAEEPIPCDLQDRYTWTQVTGDQLSLSAPVWD